VGDAPIEKLPGRIRRWLKRARLIDDLEPWERDIVRADLGHVLECEVYTATWAVEGLAVLAWALGRCEFPMHDQKADPLAVTGSLGFLADDTDAFIADARVRSAIELTACRELMYAMHGRLRQFLRNNLRRDFSTWVEEDWLKVLKLDRSHLIIDGDLGIASKPIAIAPADAVRNCEWAICERHRASIWLVGEKHPDYWGWGVDT
jgi:hypothetical protein